MTKLTIVDENIKLQNMCLLENFGINSRISEFFYLFHCFVESTQHKFGLETIVTAPNTLQQLLYTHSLYLHKK